MPTDPAPAAATMSGDALRFDPAEEFPRPPAEDFWQKYSGWLEFPLSWTAAVLFHALAAVGLLFVLPYLMARGDGAAVPIRIVAVSGDGDGPDDSPAGLGGAETLLTVGTDAFDALVKDALPTPTLPAPTVQSPPAALPDPDGGGVEEPVPPGGRRPGGGRGGTKGTAKGGTGTGGTGQRGVGWRIMFQFEDGREYARQLAAAKAVVLIPDKADKKKGTFIPDMGNPAGRRAATADDLRRVEPMLKFFEQDPKKARAFLDYLGLGGAESYFVCFPKEFVDDLARKEAQFDNLRPEDIEYTRFGFVVRGGEYDVRVLEQERRR